MKYIVYTCFFIFFLGGCSVAKKNISSSTFSVGKSSFLSESQRRKFDYFFYEGQRLKMTGKLEKAQVYFIECLKIDSLSSTSYYELANIEIGKKNYVGAQKLLSNSVRLSPRNKWYKMLLGDLYQQNNDLKNSIIIYKSLVSQFPDNEEYIYILAQLYYKNEQYEESINSYNLLEKKIGINESISLEKEKIYLKIGKKGLAFKEINKLISDNPYEPRYYGFLGDLYMVNKDLDDAEVSYKKILELEPNNGLGYFSLATIALERKDTVLFFDQFSKAINDKSLNIEVKIQHMLPFLLGKEFSSYSEKSDISSLFSLLTQVHNEDSRSFIYYANYLQNNDLKGDALLELKKAIFIQKNNSAIWQDLFLLEMGLGKFDLLYTDSKEALVFFPDEPLFNFFYALSAIQKSEFELALKVLNHGVNFVGDNINLKVQFYTYFGDVYYSLKNSSEAFKYYQMALDIDENNVVVLNNYSYYLSIEDKDLDIAEKMISKCIELDPGNYTYLDTYAWVLFRRGRFFESRYIIERAIENGGDKSDVIVEHYGDILYKNNDVDGAMVQWKKSVELGNESVLLKNKIESGSYVE